MDRTPDSASAIPSHDTRSDFWLKNYAAIKGDNQKLPILLREHGGVKAKLTATYGAPTIFFLLAGALWGAGFFCTKLARALLIFSSRPLNFCAQSLAKRRRLRWRA